MLANYQQLHVEHGVDKVTIRRIAVELVAVITGKRMRTQQMTITRIKRLILFTEIYANGIVYNILYFSDFQCFFLSFLRNYLHGLNILFRVLQHKALL